MLTETNTIQEISQQRTGRIEVWTNGIFFIVIEKNVLFELEDAENQHAFLKCHKTDRKLLILVEADESSSLSMEAREYATRGDMSEMGLATAIVIKSLAQRIVVNFIINIKRKHPVKLKIFNHKQDAISWLLSFKSNCIQT